MLLHLDKQRPELADVFIALIGVALARDMEYPAKTMFELVQRLRPDSPRLEAFQGWFCLRQKDLIGAGQHLHRSVNLLGEQAGSARSLLAIVLCAQGDPNWITHAQVIIDDGRDKKSVEILTKLMDESNIKIFPTVKRNETDFSEDGAMSKSETTLTNSEQGSNTKNEKVVYLRA